MNSKVLERLIEEVRIDRDAGRDPNAYNRMHNRHNRSWRPSRPNYVPPAPAPREKPERERDPEPAEKPKRDRDALLEPESRRHVILE